MSLKYASKELNNDKIEIPTLTDIPAKTGLGSSGSFATALTKAIYSYNQKMIGRRELAELACNIEINKLKNQLANKINLYLFMVEFPNFKLIEKDLLRQKI